MSTVLERAKIECSDLETKLTALYAFTLTPTFRSLNENAQKRLKGQAHFMENYHKMLVTRIELDLCELNKKFDT